MSMGLVNKKSNEHASLSAWGLPATTVMVMPRAVPMAPFDLLDNRKCRASSMGRFCGRCRVGLADRDEHYCSEHGADTKYRFHLNDSRSSRACLTLSLTCGASNSLH
jgi:hypothetical protein